MKEFGTVEYRASVEEGAADICINIEHNEEGEQFRRRSWSGVGVRIKPRDSLEQGDRGSLRW